MKRRIIALSLVVMMMFLAACGAKESANGGNAPANAEPKNNASAEKKDRETYVIKVGHVLPTSHQTHITLDEVFKKEVEANSDGRITVEIYPNAQLGGDRKQLESVQIGALEMCVPAASVVTGFDSDWEVLDLPFLFTDVEKAMKNLDGEFGTALNEHLTEKGMINLGFGENGLRHVINDVRPINKIEDMQGLKLRTLESPMQVAGFKAFGANPTPISFSELFTALQQKTVEGAECPMNILYSNKFYEVQKYISKTGHIYLTCPYIMNKAFFEDLPEDLQTVVADAVNATVKAQREALAADEIVNTKKMEEAGIQINDISPEEKERFVDATKSVYEEYEKNVGRKYLDLIVE